MQNCRIKNGCGGYEQEKKSSEIVKMDAHTRWEKHAKRKQSVYQLVILECRNSTVQFSLALSFGPRLVIA